MRIMTHPYQFIIINIKLKFRTILITNSILIIMEPVPMSSTISHTQHTQNILAFIFEIEFQHANTIHYQIVLLNTNASHDIISPANDQLESRKSIRHRRKPSYLQDYYCNSAHCRLSNPIIQGSTSYIGFVQSY